MSFYDVQVFPMSNRQRYEARILEAQMSIRASKMRIHEARIKIREARIQDARMKLQDLALRSDEERVKSAGEIADMWRPYKGVMEILDHHIGQKEIKEIIFTLCKYQKPCPSWYPCPPWCACGGFNNPERYTYEETHPNPLLKCEPPVLLIPPTEFVRCFCIKYGCNGDLIARITCRRHAASDFQRGAAEIPEDVDSSEEDLHKRRRQA